MESLDTRLDESQSDDGETAKHSLMGFDLKPKIRKSRSCKHREETGEQKM